MASSIVDPVVLERRLSVERLAPYRRAARNDLERAISLYEWNAMVAAAFWAMLGHVEVLVRNAMHEQLTAWSVANFDEPRRYLDPGRRLTEDARRDIAAARSRATRTGPPEAPDGSVPTLDDGSRYAVSSSSC